MDGAAWSVCGAGPSASCAGGGAAEANPRAIVQTFELETAAGRRGAVARALAQGGQRQAAAAAGMQQGGASRAGRGEDRRFCLQHPAAFFRISGLSELP